jgi:hypothetical protein
MADTYTTKNAFARVGVGGPELLSMEQVLQGVMAPESTSLQVTPMIGGVLVSAANPIPTAPGAVVPSVTTKATFVTGSKAPASAGTPEALAAAATYVQQVVICAQRAARVANTGSVWIGSSSANDSQLVELLAGVAAPGPGINGSSYTITAPPGKVIDLGDIYVDSVTVGDGVTWLGVL